MQKFKIKANFEIKSIIQLYAQWIREGKLKVNADWNRDLKVKFTVQDPCNIVRKTLRQEMADDEAWKHIVEVKVKAVEDLGCKVWLNTFRQSV